MLKYEDLSKSNQFFKSELQEKINKILDNGWFILGNELLEFETTFSNLHNLNYCIGVGNGLDALTLAIKALNIEPGSEIIVPSNTYIATILAIIHNNCIPIFVEPDINTYNINADLIEKSVTKKTKAILIVHLYGKCCEMKKILDITTKHNLFLIEDCAQSHFAKYDNKLCGTFGIVSCFSFYPTKNIGALGDGGCILTNDLEIASNIKKLRNYGSVIKYQNDIIGFNSRLDELQAGVLNIKLKYYEFINNHKRNLADIYFKYLNNNFILPDRNSKFYDVFHIFNIRHRNRDDLKYFLYKNNIQTEIHYPIPPHKQDALKSSFENSHFPISELIHNTTLSLPCSMCHTEDDIYKVVEIINKF